MSISPFPVRPASPEGERRRARLVLAIATVGIAATLLAYAVAPGVRHAVGHAAHSVRRAVSHVLDRDPGAGGKTGAAGTGTATRTPSRRSAGSAGRSTSTSR